MIYIKKENFVNLINCRLLEEISVNSCQALILVEIYCILEIVLLTDGLNKLLLYVQRHFPVLHSLLATALYMHGTSYVYW